MRVGVLPARGGRGEGYPRDLHPALPGRLPAARLQDPAPHLPRPPANCKGNNH